MSESPTLKIIRAGSVDAAWVTGTWIWFPEAEVRQEDSLRRSWAPEISSHSQVRGMKRFNPGAEVKSEALILKPGVHRWVWFRKQWKTDYEQTQAWECLGWLLQLSIGLSIVHLNRSRREWWLSSLGRHTQGRSLLDVYCKHLIVYLKVLFFSRFYFCHHWIWGDFTTSSLQLPLSH